MTIATTTLTSSTTIPESLAIAGHQAWIYAPGNDSSGIGFLRGVLKQFQTGLDLALAFGSDGSGVDATFYSTTSGGYWLWDASDNQLEAVESKMTMTTATETASDPGRQIYLQRTHTGTIGAGKGLTGIEVRSTFNGAAAAATSEVKGGEFKARHTTGNAFTVGTFKGLIGNADVKNGTVTTAWSVEASMDVAAGGSITTAALFHGSLNNSGSITSIYGLYLHGTASVELPVGIYFDNVTDCIQCNDNHLTIETITDTRNIRLNQRDYTATSGDRTAVQIKPDQTADGTAGMTGLEVSPRFSDGAGGSKLVGIMSNPDLKGSSGDITTVVRCYEAKFDGGTGRTVTGPAFILDAQTANEATITNGCFVIGATVAGGGGTGWTGFMRASASGAGGLVISANGMVKDPEDDTEAGYLQVRVGSTDYQIPVYATS